MPIGTTNPSIIQQEVIDTLSREPSWPRLHHDWPEYLIRAETSPAKDRNSHLHQKASLADCAETCEAFDDLQYENSPSGCESIFSIKEVVNDIFSGQGAAFEFDVFKVVVCKAGTAVHKGALFRHGKDVCQLWEGPRTRERYSVLGRIGSVTIICGRIAQGLQRKSGGRQLQISRGELARFICGENLSNILPTAKFLDRVNRGCFVDERRIAKICSRLRLEVEDVAFVHSTIYAGASIDRGTAYMETRRMNPPQRRAFPLIGEVDLYDLIVNQVGLPRLDVRVCKEPIADLLAAKLKLVIESCWQNTREQALDRFIRISKKLADASLSAWISYIAGSGDGDPHTSARLIVTIDKAAARHDFVNI